jgi:hypothetical protein
MENNEEIWKDIPDFIGYYQVSSIGRIKSLSISVKSRHKKGYRIKTEKIMSLGINCCGYNRIVLRKFGSHKQFSVHRLVAICFLENTNNKETVNHIKGIKTDNRVENLEWATRSENEKHSWVVLKKRHWNKGKKGKSSHCKKVIDENSGVVYCSIDQAASLNGFSQQTLSRYLNGTRKNKTKFRFL